MLELLSLIGLVVIVVLVLLLLRVRTSDRIDEMVKQRSTVSLIAGRAEYIEGMEHIPVVLSLTGKAIVYENPDMQAKLDLERIDEVEYSDELSTSHEVKHGKVLRLRSHGQTFEFILPTAEVPNWASNLPAHRMDEPGNVHAG